MANTVTVTMPRDYLGQIIDGLDVLIEQWQATAQYLETGYCFEDTCIRECSSAHEANQLAAYYIRMRDHLQSQLSAIPRQSG